MNSDTLFAGIVARGNNLVFPVNDQIGLTKREYFAALAMQGILASAPGWRKDEAAQFSLGYADALIAELSKAQP